MAEYTDVDTDNSNDNGNGNSADNGNKHIDNTYVTIRTLPGGTKYIRIDDGSGQHNIHYIDVRLDELAHVISELIAVYNTTIDDTRGVKVVSKYTF